MMTVSDACRRAPRLTWARRGRGVGRRRAFWAVFGTVPAVPIMIDVVNLPALPIAHAIQRLDARATADGRARIDRLDVADFREDLELHVSVGQRASPEQR